MAKQNESERNKEKKKEYESQSLGPDPTLNPNLSGNDSFFPEEPMTSPLPETTDAQDGHKKSGFQKTVAKVKRPGYPSKKAISPDKAGILHRPSKHGLALGDPIRKPNQDDVDE